MREEWNIYSMVVFIFSVANLLFGIRLQIVGAIAALKKNGQASVYAYNDVRMQFNFEYDRCNPITQFAATQEYLKFIKGSIILKKKGTWATRPQTSSSSSSQI